MKQAVTGVAIAVLSVGLLFGGCELMCGPAPPSPIREGMTVAELGAARPHRYHRFPARSGTLSAFDLSREDKRAFSGRIEVRPLRGERCTFAFEDGLLRERDVGKLPTHMSLPFDLPFGTLLLRLPQGTQVFVVGDYEGARVQLPGSDLPHFNGRLEGFIWDWGTIQSWKVEFHEGRAVRNVDEEYLD